MRARAHSGRAARAAKTHAGCRWQQRKLMRARMRMHACRRCFRLPRRWPPSARSCSEPRRRRGSPQQMTPCLWRTSSCRGSSCWSGACACANLLCQWPPRLAAGHSHDGLRAAARAQRARMRARRVARASCCLSLCLLHCSQDTGGRHCRHGGRGAGRARDPGDHGSGVACACWLAGVRTHCHAPTPTPGATVHMRTRTHARRMTLTSSQRTRRH